MVLSPLEYRVLEIIAQHQKAEDGNLVDIPLIVQETNQPAQEVEDAIEALVEGKLIERGQAYIDQSPNVALTRHGRAVLKKQ